MGSPRGFELLGIQYNRDGSAVQIHVATDLPDSRKKELAQEMNEGRLALDGHFYISSQEKKKREKRVVSEMINYLRGELSIKNKVMDGETWEIGA